MRVQILYETEVDTTDPEEAFRIVEGEQCPLVDAPGWELVSVKPVRDLLWHIDEKDREGAGE